MDADQRYLLKNAERAIEREDQIIQRSKSKQPRFTDTDPDQFWASTYAWLLDNDLDAPPYTQDSRIRDSWLRTFWPKEPHLAGVLNQSCLIDSNRGWKLIGGRNQVNRFSERIHNFENGKGFRHFQRKAALSFRSADIGFVGEIGREARGGPLDKLWTVDPARCRLTSNTEYPLKYYPAKGKMQAWRQEDFLHIVSMPSTDETFNDLGFCAVSRAIEIAKTMIAVYAYDHEQLGARAPKGLLLLKNISESNWETAMTSREEKLDSFERKYYGGVAVLASAGFDDIDAKLIALSNLPKDFDRKMFTDLLMFAYALVFGYDANEFWPVSGGALGRGRDTEIQHNKATSKGVLDYPNEFQESFQGLLPETILFQFEQRDDEGELREAEVRQAKANVIKTMYEAGSSLGVPMISQWQAQYLLAESGLIPDEWTTTEEPHMVSDDDGPNQDEETRVRLARTDQVQRAALAFPHDPIIEYTYRRGIAKARILWSDLEDLERFLPSRRYRRVIRQADDGEFLYRSDDTEITEADVDRAIADGGNRLGQDWLGAVTNKPMTSQEIEENPVE